MTDTPTDSALPAPLVTPEALMATLARGDAVAILDCSFDLADPAAGERAFEQGHLPGARYAHLDRDLSGVRSGRNGRHPLPARVDWATTLGHLGVGPRRHVVVYDAQGAMVAARAWWMLRWAGHAAVSVLDGGLQAWKAAGGAIETGQAAQATVDAYPLASSLTRAVFFSALTTATAFGSLWLSSHPGTSSMGKLLSLSLLTTLIAAVVFQPILMGPPRNPRP